MIFGNVDKWLLYDFWTQTNDISSRNTGNILLFLGPREKSKFESRITAFVNTLVREFISNPPDGPVYRTFGTSEVFDFSSVLFVDQKIKSVRKNHPDVICRSPSISIIYTIVGLQYEEIN